MLSLDIQVEIIKRLPVKSLIQFRSVCKAWKSLIDSSRFIAGYNDHRQHLMIRYKVENEVKYVCFVDDDTFPNQKFSLTVPSLIQVKTIISSSHGLLCLTGYYRDFYPTQMAVLWNPSIRKSIPVVLPNVAHGPFGSVLGFGVCPDSKDPNLVNITYIDDYRKIESISCITCQVMIFTLSSGKWTILSCNNRPRKSIEFTCSQTNIGWFIYWHARDRISVNGEYRNVIMSFDMSTQEFREVDLPDRLAELVEPEFFISRLRESLVVVEYDDVSYGTDSWKGICSVWMMEDGDSKAFTKLFTINLPNASVLRTIGFRKSCEPIVEMYDNSRDYDPSSRLVVYEPWSKYIKDLGIRGTKCSFFGGFYTESLLLLDHEDDRIIRRGAVKKK